jgi:hypothetical protein
MIARTVIAESVIGESVIAEPSASIIPTRMVRTRSTFCTISSTGATDHIFMASGSFATSGGLEILLTADHSLGAGNGVVTIYLDGAQVVTAAREVIPATQTSGWNSLDLYASRAVYSGAQPGGPYWMDIDQVYVSVR